MQTWTTMNYITQSVMRNLSFWLTLGVTVVLCVIPVSLYQRVTTLYADGIINNLRVQKYEFGLKIKKIARKIEKMGELTRSFAKFKKIMNDNKYIPDNYADKKIKNLVDQFNKQSSKYKDVDEIEIKHKLPVRNHSMNVKCFVAWNYHSI